MKKSARTRLYCGPMLALTLVASGCGGEPIDDQNDEEAQAIAEGLVNLEDAERGTIVGAAEARAEGQDAGATSADTPEAGAACKPDLIIQP